MIKQDDTAPSLSATLLDDGELIDLTGASVHFVMRALVAAGEGRTEPTAGPAAVDAPAVAFAGGAVRYDWAEGDTAQAGRYVAEFKVTRDGRVSTYPATGYIPIVVLADLRG